MQSVAAPLEGQESDDSEGEGFLEGEDAIGVAFTALFGPAKPASKVKGLKRSQEALDADSLPERRRGGRVGSDVVVDELQAFAVLRLVLHLDLLAACPSRAELHNAHLVEQGDCPRGSSTSHPDRASSNPGRPFPSLRPVVQLC